MSKSVLVLRACHSDMTSTNAFVWPNSGYVEAPDWLPIKECGNGLHGWLHGHGDGHTSNYWFESCIWLVVKVKMKDVIDLDGKVKFKCGEVVFCGDRKGATDYITKYDKKASDEPVVGAIVTKGKHGIATSGYRGISTSGKFGTSISGGKGIAISGYNGMSTTGIGGTSISGKNGTSISGFTGKVKSGVDGTICIKVFDKDRYIYGLGHIGRDGLEPNVFYCLDKNNKFIKAY